MEQTNYEKATFGAGCFWGVEAAYRQIHGVKSTRVGYSGGHTTEPSYREVCAGNTNHAEVVEVTFDPEKVSYEELLDVFWAIHDPTQVNRQGPDVGTQYRTVVFFHSPEQEKSALASRDAVQERSARPIATQIVAAEPFWEAEDYHQQYLEKRGAAHSTVR
jgi:peptide-methionine (S)-S-oxide reductase